MKLSNIYNLLSWLLTVIGLCTIPLLYNAHFKAFIFYFLIECIAIYLAFYFEESRKEEIENEKNKNKKG